jgi:ferric-dicitrate binding protein FerR (iron transport regulator)
VDAGSAKIMVLGTSFQVKAAKDSAVEVMVTKGRVMLFKVNPATGDTASVILTAGTKGILPLKTLVPVLVENGNADDLYWFDHTLEFRKTPLSEVFRILEKYYSITVDCKNDQINRCMLTATFVNDPIERIMEVIGLSFDLKIDASDQTYIITGNGCTEGNR